GDPHPDGAEFMPLRNPHADPAGDPPGRRRAAQGRTPDRLGGAGMNPGKTIPTPSRRGFLAGGGALVVSFSLVPHLRAQTPSGAGPALPGSLGKTPMLDSWIRIDGD